MPTRTLLPNGLEHQRVLNAQQTAKLFGLSTMTIRRLYWAGKLPPAIRLSQRRLGWRVGDLLQHLANGGVDAA